MPYSSRGTLDGFRASPYASTRALYRGSSFRDASIASLNRYRVTLYRYGKALYRYRTVLPPFLGALDEGRAAPYGFRVSRPPSRQAPDRYREALDGYGKRAYRSGEALL